MSETWNVPTENGSVDCGGEEQKYGKKAQQIPLLTDVDNEPGDNSTNLLNGIPDSRRILLGITDTKVGGGAVLAHVVGTDHDVEERPAVGLGEVLVLGHDPS